MTKVGAVLVAGGGIGGMQAALDLAESDFKVYLVERGPSIGGVMAQLDKTFPTNDCAMCTMAPRLVEVARHPNIELLTNTQIEGISGEAGRFEVTVRRRTRYVDENKCTGCGICAEHCPVLTRDAFNCGLSARPAVFLLFPQAIPRIFTIDRSLCLGCGLCKNLCGPGAIDYRLGDQVRTLEAGAVVAAPGFDLYDAHLSGEFGYGRYPNVVSSLEFERILSASGPYRGSILRPSDGRTPRRVAFIQCVGSREETRPWCSSVCCMYATKHALIAMEHAPGLQCTIFYIDLRAFGKGFDAYYTRAREAGVRYVRCRPSTIKEVPGTRDLRVKYHPASEKPITEVFDVVVLSCGLGPSEASRDLAARLGITLDPSGFYRAGRFTPLETERPGIYVCGPFTDPKDIPETVMGASGSAVKAMGLLASERGKMVAPKTYPPEMEVAGSGAADWRLRLPLRDEHRRGRGRARGRPVRPDASERRPRRGEPLHLLHRLAGTHQEGDPGAPAEPRRGRVVHAPDARAALPQHGPRGRAERVPVRDGEHPRPVLLGAHADARRGDRQVEGPRADGRRQGAAARAAARAVDEDQPRGARGGRRGGGDDRGPRSRGSGLHGAPRRARGRAGGTVRRLKFIPGHGDPTAELAALAQRTKAAETIQLHLGAEIVAIDGSIGKFKTKVREADGREIEFDHGAVVVATGAEEYRPTEYLYGQDARVVTQLEFEERFHAGRNGARRIVMIQCVGSRTKERPYCRRVCCTGAITNALQIKKADPSTQVAILYRDIRTYGMREELYRQARKAGVLFVRFEDEDEPRVAANGGALTVTVNDALMKRPLAIDADLVVLSAAIVPRADEQGPGPDAQGAAQPGPLLPGGAPEAPAGGLRDRRRLLCAAWPTAQEPGRDDRAGHGRGRAGDHPPGQGQPSRSESAISAGRGRELRRLRLLHRARARTTR